MNKQEMRKQTIYKVVQEQNGISIKDLAEKTGVSEMTIRRDIKFLVLNEAVNLINGVVVPIANSHGMDYIDQDEDAPNDYFVSLAMTKNPRSKELIAKAAAKLIEPGDIVIVDIGSTTSLIPRYIPHGLPISFFCSTSTALIEAIRKKFKRLIFSGGFYHPKTEVFESPAVCELLKKMRATKVFVSAAGVSDDLGLTCVNDYESDIKAAAIACAQHKYLAVDSSKFGKVRENFFACLSEIDTVITDNKIPEEWIEIFNKRGIELIIV